MSDFDIKSIRGWVLYTAEGTSNLGEALTQAVKARADLNGVNLNGANLNSTNLGRANLRRAGLSGADLRSAYLSGADLSGADLSGANLNCANLGSANLRSANLNGAQLRSAYLRNADLRNANLKHAILADANLKGARGVNPYLTTPLHILTDQPGPVRAYKLVNADGQGPIRGGVTYTLGETVVEPNTNHDPVDACGAGLNVATLDWCMREWSLGYRILVVEFDPADIAAIPHGSDGKFRTTRLTVVGEKNLAELGLIDTEEETDND